MKGDVAAEQNHSSVAAYLGEGATWTIAENIYQQLRRHKDIVRRHMAVEDNLHSYIRVYKTTYQGYKGLSDMEAKLSGNAYQRFFVKALESVLTVCSYDMVKQIVRSQCASLLDRGFNF